MLSKPLNFTKKPITFLAPMQDITDEGFMRAIAKRGSPDFHIAEYFRIHEYFELEPHVLKSVLWSPTTVSAQFIGENVDYILKAIKTLQKLYPQITMLDLNLGCPAPKVYKKNVGGGLLRDYNQIAKILKVMRNEWEGTFSVKMRTGFDSDDNFKDLFSLILEGQPDYITIHARTVKQLYKGEPNYAHIATAVKMCDKPIIANGDITSAKKALEVVKSTGCAGVMCGRHAVRNPWIFRQIDDIFASRDVFQPKLRDVREYIDDLWNLIGDIRNGMKYADSRLKKFLNFVGASVDEDGEFLYNMRRTRGIDELFAVCDKYLIDNGNAQKDFNQEIFEGVCSRPNHEK